MISGARCTQLGCNCNYRRQHDVAAQLVDWYDTVQGDMTYDGIHLNPAGATAYTNLIARAVRGR